jgi:hypothetical protein
MPEDYTFEGMLKTFRRKVGREPTDDERATINQQAAEIARLEKVLEASKAKDKEAAEQAEILRIHEAIVKDVQSELGEVPKRNLDPFWVGLCGIGVIFILVVLAGYGIFRLLKWVL